MLRRKEAFTENITVELHADRVCVQNVKKE